MTSRSLGYWTSNEDWWEYNKDGVAVIKDDAPEEAKRSYAEYLEHQLFRMSLTLSDEE